MMTTWLDLFYVSEFSVGRTHMGDFSLHVDAL